MNGQKYNFSTGDSRLLKTIWQYLPVLFWRNIYNIPGSHNHHILVSWPDIHSDHEESANDVPDESTPQECS